MKAYQRTPCKELAETNQEINATALLEGSIRLHVFGFNRSPPSKRQMNMVFDPLPSSKKWDEVGIESGNPHCLEV